MTKAMPWSGPIPRAKRSRLFYGRHWRSIIWSPAMKKIRGRMWWSWWSRSGLCGDREDQPQGFLTNSIRSARWTARSMANMEDAHYLLILKHTKKDNVGSHRQRANREFQSWALMRDHCAVRKLFQWLQGA